MSEKVNSEHQLHPGLKVLSTKQLQMIKKVNSDHPRHPVLEGTVN